MGVGRTGTSVGAGGVKVGVWEFAEGVDTAGDVAAGDMISIEKLPAASTREPSRKTMNGTDDLTCFIAVSLSACAICREGMSYLTPAWKRLFHCPPGQSKTAQARGGFFGREYYTDSIADKKGDEVNYESCPYPANNSGPGGGKDPRLASSVCGPVHSVLCAVRRGRADRRSLPARHHGRAGSRADDDGILDLVHGDHPGDHVDGLQLALAWAETDGGHVGGVLPGGDGCYAARGVVLPVRGHDRTGPDGAPVPAGAAGRVHLCASDRPDHGTLPSARHRNT